MRTLLIIIALLISATSAQIVSAQDRFASSDYECAQLTPADHIACSVLRQKGPSVLLVWIPPAPAGWTKADSARRSYQLQQLADNFVARGGRDIKMRTRDIHGTYAGRICQPRQNGKGAGCLAWHKQDETDLKPWWRELMQRT